jgi:hypothetical protein
MSSGLQKNLEKEYDDWYHSEERQEKIKSFKESEKYAKYKKLKAIFGEYEEYLRLKEDIKDTQRRLDVYDLL